MTPQQKVLVQTTFARIAPSADEAAAMFYGRLFELDPTLRPLLKGDLREQGRKLMQMLTVAVRGLDRLDERDGGACAPVDVEPGATSLGAPIPMREMAGALIVDPKDNAARRDRIFVITEWNTLKGSELAEILSASPEGR